MIRKVHFKNFRCLRDVELTLEPLTVLVGPNSSGKTTVLTGLDFNDPKKFSEFDRWQRDATLTTTIEWTYDTGHVSEFESPGRGRRSVINLAAQEGHVNYITVKEAKRHLSQSFTLDLSALRQQNMLAAAEMLSGSGDNLTNAFASLTRQHQGLVAAELCRLVPMFKDVDLQPIAQGHHRLRFQDRWKPSLWLAPNQVSDGTMLLMAFIVLRYQLRQVNLITIEEPERALHPYLLDELIQMLRKMTTGEIGQMPVQIVLATHSAELLDYVRPEEVRFLTRSQEDGSVQVQQAPSGTTDWRRVYEEYNQSLGSIWLSGGMGGVPGA